MTKPMLSASSGTKTSQNIASRSRPSMKRRRSSRTNKEQSDVLVSAVISTYLLTHLHHLLQRAEYGATKEGRVSQANNFAQLRKVLCMDARSMEDASAVGTNDGDSDNLTECKIGPKAA